MSHGVEAALRFQLTRKVVVEGQIIFETAWRIGTGKEGETMSDLGVMRTPDGSPILPGSSIKGKLRHTCESLAHALKLRACLLSFPASGVRCTSDVTYYHQELRPEYQRILYCREQGALNQRLQWIEDNTCDVCKLFGSPVRAARLRCGEGRLVPASWVGVIQVRDGVVLDRDSHTAVNGLKYDYEVVPPDAIFAVRFELDNPSDNDLGLLGAGLFDWDAGFSLGGFTSRGLGRAHLQDVRVRGVDFDKPDERLRYLTAHNAEDRLNDRGNWKTYFASRIEPLARP